MKNGAVVWITGLSAAGKSTLARHVARRCHGVYLDADNERRRWSHIGFNSYDRLRSMARLAQRVRCFQQRTSLVVVAAISPTHRDRRMALSRLRPAEWLLVHMATSLPICEQRDGKKLYQRAHQGQLTYVCGIDVVFEKPRRPSLFLPGHRLSRLACMAQTLIAIRRYQRLRADFH